MSKITQQTNNTRYTIHNTHHTIHTTTTTTTTPPQLRYEDFTTSFTNASKAFLNFVNASSPEDEGKLLKSMSACQDTQGVGLRRKRALLGVEEPVLGVDTAPLVVTEVFRGTGMHT